MQASPLTAKENRANRLGVSLATSEEAAMPPVSRHVLASRVAISSIGRRVKACGLASMSVRLSSGESVGLVFTKIAGRLAAAQTTLD